VSRATAVLEVDVPSDAHVGDDFRITGDVRIILIREPQIDVTYYGGKQETLPGEREYEFQILNAGLARVLS
jgi:hypothetical protein